VRIFALALLAAACSKPAPPAPPRLPETLPSAIPVAELAGAEACAECHRAAYDAWSRSPHGRAMAKASAATVRGDFRAGSVGGVALAADGGWSMDGQRVDLVLASGRQHQLYVTHGDDGSWSLLPLIWSTWTKEWLPTAFYQPGDLNARDLTRGCLNCHLSQGYRNLRGGKPETAWIDLSINCESCHGPGREHIRRRRAGRPDASFRDLRGLGKEEEARVCGQCHGFALKPYVFPRAADGLPEVFVTSLINDGLRPDGTQRATTYQYPGHVLSQCFQKGALTCKGCHEPHALGTRDFIGEPAGGADSNRQCTICHRDRADAKLAARHSHHAAKVRCIDCHMAYSWIGDDEKRKQRTADHSISIPRPRETLELKTPNACNTCHRDRTPEWALAALKGWGYARALEMRDWVATVAAARAKAPAATERLVRLIEDPATGRYLRDSAIDLTLLQPPSPQLVPVLTPLAAAPDPETRAAAIRALLEHDPAGRREWAARGLGDAHPFVRMETFAAVRDPSMLTPAAIDRDRADTLAYKQRLSDGFVHLITLRYKRGEFREALALADELDRLALPREKSALGLDSVRARIQDALAKKPQR
jgi:hypothetical protein